MNSIELMVEEHKNIRRMLLVVRKACLQVMQGKDINYDDFDKMIDFIRNYADVHHHGKEEKFLFKEMEEKLGNIGVNLVKHGMLVEHDLGRLYVSELSDALGRVKAGDEESRLDVIANGVGYVNHLFRHIEKEDAVVYTFAEKKLPEEILNLIHSQTEEFEKQAQKKGIQDQYISLLQEMENKYIH